MKMNWIKAAHHFSQEGDAYVIVTLIGVAGSTPRDSGTKMLIALEETFDSIGGGHLEHKAIKFAKKLLAEGKSCQHLEHFQLGIHHDQCCGGSANVLFECFAKRRVNIMVFGAGHVAEALIPILAALPCQINLSYYTLRYQLLLLIQQISLSIDRSLTNRYGCLGIILCIKRMYNTAYSCFSRTIFIIDT